MIEVVSDERCIRCDICVRICPANVFAKDDQGLPVIARQNDCQTCYLCEIYCPTDALFVAHAAEGPVGVSAAWVEERNLWGSYPPDAAGEEEPTDAGPASSQQGRRPHRHSHRRGAGRAARQGAARHYPGQWRRVRAARSSH